MFDIFALRVCFHFLEYFFANFITYPLVSPTLVVVIYPTRAHFRDSGLVREPTNHTFWCFLYGFRSGRSHSRWVNGHFKCFMFVFYPPSGNNVANCKRAIKWPELVGIGWELVRIDIWSVFYRLKSILMAKIGQNAPNVDRNIQMFVYIFKIFLYGSAAWWPKAPI